jgi:D-alanine-D-alanine ligase
MAKICPPALSPEKMNEIRDLSRRAFNSLGLCDYARVDFRMDAEGNFYLLEINSMASLGLSGSFYHSAVVAGYTYEGLINRILEHASLRYFGSSYQQNPDIIGPATDNIKSNKTARIRSYIRSQMGTVEDLIDKFVAVSSNAYNSEGVNYLNKNIAKMLHQLGFEKQIFPQTEVGDIYYFKNHSDENDDVLLFAHSDTVSDYRNHLSIYHEQNKIFGSGIAESKAGLAIMITALRTLKFTKTLKKLKIGILLMSDDTIGGHFSRDIVKERSSKTKKIIGLKNGTPEGAFYSSCSGKLKFRIDYSVIEDGSSLLKQYVNFLNKINKLPETIATRVRIDKSDYNYISESNIFQSTIKVTLSFDSVALKEQIEQKVKEFAKPNANTNIKHNIKRLLNRKPLTSENRNETFCLKINNLAKKLEVNTAEAHLSISSNICNVIPNVPAIEGMGALGGNLRTRKEFILKDSLLDRTVLLTMLLDSSSEE